MAEEMDDFVSMEESLESIEAIVSDIKDSVVNNDNSSDDFISSDNIDFIRSVKGINDSLESLNSFLQNRNIHDVNDEIEHPAVVEETKPDLINMIADSKQENEEFVEQLKNINATLADIKNDVSDFDLNQIFEQIKSAQDSMESIRFDSIQNIQQPSLNTINEVPAIFSNTQLEEIERSFAGINQEIKLLDETLSNDITFSGLKESLLDLQDSFSNVEIKGDFLSDLKGIDWNKELIEPLEKARNIINEPVVKGNITEVLNSITDNIDTTKLHELESSISGVVNQLKGFRLEPGVLNSLEEFEEKISGFKGSDQINKEIKTNYKFESVNDNLLDFKSPELNTEPTFNMTGSETPMYPGIENEDFVTENSSINVIKDQYPKMQSKSSENAIFETENIKMNDFVSEPYAADKALDETKTTIIKEEESVLSQMQILIQLVQKQTELMVTLLPKPEEAKATNNSTKPLIEYGDKPENKSLENAQQVQSNNDAIMISLFQQLMSLMTDINSNISGLSVSLRTSNQKPITL